MSTPVIQRFASQEALSEAVAELVTAAVNEGVQQRGVATLAFSGGRTPEFFLPKLSQLALDWGKVNVTLADERWVGEDSPHSNTAMIKRTLLQNQASKARFIPLVSDAKFTASDGIASSRDKMIPATQPYDLVLLGMGNDGHFASLFPTTPRLAELVSAANAERLVAVPAPTTAVPHVERVSMTLAELKRTPRLKLILQGDEKLRVLAEAFELKDITQRPAFALGAIDVMWCP
jgi:6-phosphogluconolactonase